MSISERDAAGLMDALSAVVARASSVIRAIEAQGVTHRIKADSSPVTAADEAAEETILAGVAKLLPGIPVLAEEMAGRGAIGTLGASFVIVDPLDGTKEFIAGNGQYSVNLGIVTDGRPLAGILAAPAQGRLWRGVVGRGAERLNLRDDSADAAEPIRTRPYPTAGAVALTSRSHLDPATEAFLDRLGPVTRQPGGSALKFCRLAEGSADVYPRLSMVCEWDAAAGEALLMAAGGTVRKPGGGTLQYGQQSANFRVPAFIAWGDPAAAARFPG